MKTPPIFARAMTPRPLETLPPATPAAIAAEIRKAARLQVAERELAAARQRRDTLVSEHSEHMERLNARASATVHPSLRRLETERRAVESQIDRLRPQVKALRVERAALVTEALAPLRRERAARLLVALAEFRDAARVLQEIEVEIERAGGEPTWLQLGDLGQIETMARRWAMPARGSAGQLGG